MVRMRIRFRGMLLGVMVCGVWQFNGWEFINLEIFFFPEPVRESILFIPRFPRRRQGKKAAMLYCIKNDVNLLMSISLFLSYFFCLFFVLVKKYSIITKPKQTFRLDTRSIVYLSLMKMVKAVIVGATPKAIKGKRRRE